MNLNNLFQTQDTRFFLDTCFALKPETFEILKTDVLSKLESNRQTLIVTLAVYREIEDKMKSRDDALKKQATTACHFLGRLQKTGLVRLIGRENDPFADQSFIERFAKHRTEYNLVLFTIDRELTRNLLQLNLMGSSKSDFEIYIIGFRDGKLKLFQDRLDPSRKKRSSAKKKQGPFQNKKRSPKSRGSTYLFPKEKHPRSLNKEYCGGDRNFQKGDQLFDSNGKKFRLGDHIASGGEGNIFVASGRAFSKSSIAKVFFPEQRLRWREEKIAMMTSRPVELSNVAWPQKSLFDTEGRFVGYLMEHASGLPLQRTVFSKSALKKNFPDWNRRELYQLAATVSSVVMEIQKLGVLIGDINPMNVLVSSPTQIHWVDADSFQVCDFPCPVGMVNFRAPEIRSTSYEEFLRNDDHERFALATLIFMILMPGKPPFSFQGGGDPAKNIQSGKFPYLKDRGKIPAGPYRYIWSYFPRSIREAFGSAFTGQPSQRPSTKTWIDLLKRHERRLENPKTQGHMEIWPLSFCSYDKDELSIQCSACGANFITTKKAPKNGKILCSNCIDIRRLAKKSGKNFQCVKCGNLFQITYGALQKHRKPLEICPDCIEQIASQPRNCSQCGRTFTMENGEVMFFLANDVAMPKRCKPCRKGRPEDFSEDDSSKGFFNDLWDSLTRR